jgi:hypothetical protein
MASAQSTATLYGGVVNSCHLAPSVLGGSGRKANVAACWRQTNYGAGNSMRSFEQQAQKAVNAKMAVEYLAMPVYSSKTSTIPIGFQLSYLAQSLTGGPSTGNSVYVPNDANSTLPNLGN